MAKPIQGVRINYDLPAKVDGGKRKAVNIRPKHLMDKLAAEAENEKAAELRTYSMDPDMVEVTKGLWVLRSQLEKSKEKLAEQQLQDEMKKQQERESGNKKEKKRRKKSQSSSSVKRRI